VRLQVSRELMQAMYQADRAELRQMIKQLFDDPRPGWAMPVTGEADSYEFTSGGLWVRYRIQTTPGGETVIQAAIVSRPSFL
jgi:hypothetical protein